MLMANRSQEWLKQAERDLDLAKISAEAGHFEWACFAAQQSAEKAVKALHLSEGEEAWGHVIARLLKALPYKVPRALVKKAMTLDGYYIAPRYPNSHAEGAPFEHFSDLQSKQAIKYAREILDFARSQMAQT